MKHFLFSLYVASWAGMVVHSIIEQKAHMIPILVVWAGMIFVAKDI